MYIPDAEETAVRVFKTKDFARFARWALIEGFVLYGAILRAEQQIIDADLGGGLIKQRVPCKGRGRSGGFRTLIAYRRGDIAVFLHGFSKADQDNLDPDDLKDLKAAANSIVGLDQAMIAKALRLGLWAEITEYGQKI